MKTDKTILDACCGSRMMWFDKHNPMVLFQDIRELDTELCDGRRLEIKPDVIADFREMPYADKTFRLVVMDPPHMVKLGQGSWMAKKYGVLSSSWQTDLKLAFDECMRVLQDNGILVFKWNEAQVTLNEVLKLIPYKPLFGHTSGRHGKTKWLCFMKIETHASTIPPQPTTGSHQKGETPT